MYDKQQQSERCIDDKSQVCVVACLNCGGIFMPPLPIQWATGSVFDLSIHTCMCAYPSEGILQPACHPLLVDYNFATNLLLSLL